MNPLAPVEIVRHSTQRGLRLGRPSHVEQEFRAPLNVKRRRLYLGLMEFESPLPRRSRFDAWKPRGLIVGEPPPALRFEGTLTPRGQT